MKMILIVPNETSGVVTGQCAERLIFLGRSRHRPAQAFTWARTLRPAAALTDAGMIFIPSQGGRSHRTDEMSDWGAICATEGRRLSCRP